jgi:hypothetical protein
MFVYKPHVGVSFSIRSERAYRIRKYKQDHNEDQIPP